MKMKQWICPGITRKEYLNICGRSLAFGMWVVQVAGGLPVFEPDTEMAKGYRLPRQFQSQNDAVEFVRGLLSEDGFEVDVSTSTEVDCLLVSGCKENSIDEEGYVVDMDERLYYVFCISEQSRVDILEEIRLELGL